MSVLNSLCLYQFRRRLDSGACGRFRRASRKGVRGREAGQRGFPLFSDQRMGVRHYYTPGEKYQRGRRVPRPGLYSHSGT